MVTRLLDKCLVLGNPKPRINLPPTLCPRPLGSIWPVGAPASTSHTSHHQPAHQQPASQLPSTIKCVSSSIKSSSNLPRSPCTPPKASKRQLLSKVFAISIWSPPASVLDAKGIQSDTKWLQNGIKEFPSPPKAFCSWLRTIIPRIGVHARHN